MDDGSTSNGFGTGRHDQTLSSIYVCLLGLNIFRKGHFYLKIGKERVLFQVTADTHKVYEKTHIYIVRKDKVQDLTSYIQYKKSASAY